MKDDNDHNASLLCGDPSAPVTTEPLPNLDRARRRAFCNHEIEFDELGYWKCVNCGIEGHRENVYRKAREEYERAVVIEALAAFRPYLKDGETPIERLERERRDNSTLLGLLAAEKRQSAELTKAVQGNALAAVKARDTSRSLNHYWTPDPTKRFCTICGDNDLGSVWGIHRFQIQPHDPDFKPQTGSGNDATHEHSDTTHRSAAK